MSGNWNEVMGMRLLQMSLAGGVLILAITAVRAVFINKLPKRTFLVLWGVAMMRLLIPASVPSVLSVYNLLGQGTEIAGISGGLTEAGLFQGQTGAASAGERSGTDSGAGMKPKENGSADSTEGALSADTGNRTAAKGLQGAAGQTAGRLVAFEVESLLVAASDSLRGEVWISGWDIAGKAVGISDIDNRHMEVNGTSISEEGQRTASAWHGLPGRQRIFGILWCIGAMICAIYFTVSCYYLRWKYRTAIPVQNDFLKQWLEEHRLWREVRTCVSDRISAPMTYGIFRPVILLPGNLNLEDKGQLACILTHEYVHIRRFDTAKKLAATLALCIHWFNPLVWAMYILFNRDVEMACDEGVVRRLGAESRSAYALALISLEEQKSGLVPLGNHFSKNAIEERITAIMKIKKTSFAAILLAVALVSSVTTVFATSAFGGERKTNGMPETDTQIPLSDRTYTQEEWEKLRALRFDGYEEMSVRDFQNKVWELTDSEEYRDTLESFSLDATLYEQRDRNDTAAFLFYVLSPLTAEKWESRSFGGSVTTDYPGAADNAVLEYEIILTIQDAEKLTVGEYRDTRAGVAKGLESWMAGRTEEELQEEDLMNTAIDSEIANLERKWGSESLRIQVNPYYVPLVNADIPDDQALDDQALEGMALKIRQRQWDEILTPYVPFGLSYEYDPSSDDFKLYFQGKEVRGLVDEEEGIWFSEHSGISTYGEGAVELYAVYEDGKLAGLREATEEEQKAWTQMRQANTDSLTTGVEEERGNPGTEEDYQSLLALMAPGYEAMSLTEFNGALLEWANENHDRMERIGRDTAWNDIQVPLQEDELSFVKLTANLSGTENGTQIRNQNRGREEDPVHDRYLPDKIVAESGMAAWCSLFYQFSYHIDDKNVVTVEERDRCIGGFMEAVHAFWEDTDVESMLKMEEKDVVEELQRIAALWSDGHIAITVREDYVSFEHMDERGIQ